MFYRLRVFGAALIAAGFLSACSGAGNVASSTGSQIPSSTQSSATSPQGAPGATAVSERDALATAQSGDRLHANLPVQPSSLALTLPTAQTLTVTVKQKTVVFAASSDPKIATVNPIYVDVDTITGGSGTAIFTVTPHAVGKAFIGLIDAQRMYAIVPVTVSGAKLGASKIYVSNANNTVTSYNADGIPSTTITAGLSTPTGLAVDANGKIYVTNFNNSTVTTYNADGTQTTPTISAGLSLPIAVAVDAAGKIYVGNFGGNTVTTYNADGTQTTPTISVPNFGVAVDAAGKIYVVNTLNGSVTTFTANGVQTTPTITAGLKAPEALAVDANGKIYVVSQNGLTTYTGDGTQTTPTIPAGPTCCGTVAVDAAGKIYVTNTNTVNTFNADGTPSTPTITGLNEGPEGIAVH